MTSEPKTTAGGDENDLLLPELWREILIRVPVKSILRCRSVCKSWYSIVSCPNFISGYSIRNLNKNGNRLFLQLSKGSCAHDVSSFSSHDKSFMESGEHDEIPESFLGGCTSIVGSCNGLICLMKYVYTDDDSVKITNLLIWNPTIRKRVELSSLTYGRFPTYFGFGFDSKTSDYKVLSCSYSDDDSPNMIYQIFDLRKGVWRDISPKYGPSLWHTVYGDFADCYLDGAVHWWGPEILFSFNFNDECFREINLSDCAKFIRNVDDGDSNIRTKCVAFRGLIHLIVFRVWPNGRIDMSKSCSVWAMKKYGVTESWTKVSDITLQSDQIWPSAKLMSLPVLLWEKGEVLMMYNLQVDNEEDIKWKQGLVLHTVGSRKFECIFSINKCILGLCLYEESLVLL